MVYKQTEKIIKKSENKFNTARESSTASSYKAGYNSYKLEMT